MALFEGISLDPTLRNSIRTFLSSVGGFSQPARKRIRSLQDLLQTIQRFDLQYFRGVDLDHIKYVGEGVSYKVSCNRHKGSGQLFAVKQVKLPSAATNFEAFERQVACVLRDVEIMSWLSSHENVLNIIGYGWDTFSSGFIPFLITEYAGAGSLRQFLRQHEVSIYEKLVLCRDVLEGLQALHNCGIAHGDMKLDNILAIPWHSETAIRKTAVDSQVRSHRIKACVSDFGHALHLIPGNEDVAGWERYGGTLVYNAPEVSATDDRLEKGLDFRKCDIWSFGLLCWEALRDGREFYTHPEIQRVVTSTASSLRSSNTLVTTSGFMSAEASSHFSTSTLVAELETAASTFARLACEEANDLVASELSPRTAEKLMKMFRLSLCACPEERIADIAFLPFSLSSATQLNAPEVSVALLEPLEEGLGSFEVFRKLRNLPHEVKQRILSDSKRVASTPGNNTTTSKAAFQAGIACISGFGCEIEPNEALHWLSVSASKGSKPAECFLPFFENCRYNTATTSSTDCFKRLLRTSFVMNDSDTLHRDGTVVTANPEPVEPHEHTFGDGTYYVNKAKFQFACRSGNTQEVRLLQSIDLNRKERDGWGACPLHWIFMFPEGDIEEMVQLLISKINTWAAYRDALTSSYILVDPQFPVTLSGTPLAFAASVASVTAVRALLRIGADPCAGTYSYSPEGSAWYIACKYHLADILRLFVEHLEQAPSAKSASEKASYLLRLYEHSTIAFSEATYSERVFFHSNKIAEAAGRTALLLLHHFKPLLRFEGPIFLSDSGGIAFSNDLPQTRWNPLSLYSRITEEQWTSDVDLAPSTDDYVSSFNQAKIVAALCLRIIHSGDFKALPAVFETVRDEILESRYRRSIFNKLLLHCTSRACSGVLDIDDSLRILQACLDAGAHIDCAEETFQGSLPINTVIQNGNANIFEWFIQKGADLAAKSGRGDTPLHFAVSCGFSTTVDMSVFLALGASADIENEYGISPLHLAIMLDREEDFKEMLDQLVSSGKTPRYQSLLELASAYPNPEPLSHILDMARKSPLSADLELIEALANAIEHERSGNVRILVSSGAPVSEPLPCSWSCLHMAVYHGFEDSVRELLRADCLEIDRRCPWPACELPVPGSFPHLSKNMRQSTTAFVAGWTALQVAVLRPQSRNCAYLLIDAGADVNVEDRSGTTVVELSVQRPRIGDWQSLATKLLCKDRIRPLELLQRALMSQDVEWATFLLRSGLLEGRMNGSEGSPLHVLAGIHWDASENRKGHYSRMFDLTKMIIEAGAEPNRTDEEGHTPLELSTLRNNAPICAALLEYHIDGEHDKRRNGWTAGQPFEALPSSTKKLLERGWSCAVRCRAWATICEFHRSGIMLPTAELDFDNGCALFECAFQNNMHATLRLFVGSYDGSDHPRPDWDPHLHQFWQKICATQRIISGCESRIMHLKMGSTPIISLEKMSELGYYEAQAEESLKEFVGIDFGNNPDPSEVQNMWDVFDDRQEFFTTLSTDTAVLDLGTFGYNHSQDEPGMSYKQVSLWGWTFITDENTGRVIDGGGYMGAQEKV